MVKYLYRFEYTITCWDLKTCKLFLQKFNVLRETELGYWFHYHGEEKWTSNKAKSRFAYPTKKEALINFIKRKEFYKSILDTRLEEVILCIKAAKELIDQPNLEEEINKGKRDAPKTSR